VEPGLIAAAALVGLLVGLAAGLASRVSERQQTRVPPQPEPILPSGVAEVLSVLPSLAVVLDAGDTVLRASPAAYALGIVRGDRIVGDELVDLARTVRRDGQIRQVDLDLPRGLVDGATMAASVRVAPLGAHQILVLVEDRTDAKRIDAIRRDFVANVSHELKTPVGALALLAETVLHAADDPEAVRRFAGRMQQESERLSNLVQELIDLSRLESRDPLREPARVDLDDVVAAAVDRSRAIAVAKDIELVTGGSPHVEVLGDASQLVMAVGNLVENAVNYSPPHTRVAISVRRERDLAEISVTDQGIGIAQNDLTRVFERFYRVDPARSRATGGTGLGLSIVKHIAHNHGGDVQVWSVEGSGSTFTLRLRSVAAGQPAPAEERVR
jgi:two-component system sensor histidine kinase SenX3